MAIEGTLMFDHDEPYGACGVRHIYKYSDDNDHPYDIGYADIDDLQVGAAGLNMAAFIQGCEKSDEAYKQLTAKFKVVYESSWRKNHNSNNMFKLVIFDGLN